MDELCKGKSEEIEPSRSQEKSSFPLDADDIAWRSVRLEKLRGQINSNRNVRLERLSERINRNRNVRLEKVTEIINSNRSVRLEKLSERINSNRNVRLEKLSELRNIKLRILYFNLMGL